MTTLPLPPSTNHGYAIGQGRMYKTKDTNAWFLVAKQLLKKSEKPLGTVDITLIIRLYFPNRRKRDIDGPIKFIQDVLAEKYANIIHDDSQITALYVHKDFSKNSPRCEVEVYAA